MEKYVITLDEFLALPTEEVAQRVRAAGPQVFVFPINGTRRWFTLEYGKCDWDDPIAAFMDIASQNHTELYRLFFEHGIKTLITPVIGEEILTRGESYMGRIGADGYARLASGEDFLHFYDEFDVRVRFYGNYRDALTGTAYSHLIDQFDAITTKTIHHNTYRLFFGAFADNSSAWIGRMAVEHFQKFGEIPDQHVLVESYYGEYVEPVSVFIGFDKLSVFDYPLLGTGEEDLYFTVAPSPYMTARQLRIILYDHLFTRRVPGIDYNDLSTSGSKQLRKFYTDNKDNILGTGELMENIWVPHLANTKRNRYDR